jgi:hypothetical protein
VEGASDVEGEAAVAGAGFEYLKGRGVLFRTRFWVVVFAGPWQVQVEQRDYCGGVMRVYLE